MLKIHAHLQNVFSLLGWLGFSSGWSWTEVCWELHDISKLNEPPGIIKFGSIKSVGNVRSSSPTSAPHSSLPNNTGLPTFITFIISYHRSTAARSVSWPSAANHNNLIQVPLEPRLSPAPNCNPANFGLLNVGSLNNKAFLCRNFITFKKFLFLQRHGYLRETIAHLSKQPPLILHTSINPGCQAGWGGLLLFIGKCLNALPFRIVVLLHLNILFLW